MHEKGISQSGLTAGLLLAVLGQLLYIKYLPYIYSNHMHIHIYKGTGRYKDMCAYFAQDQIAV